MARKAGTGGRRAVPELGRGRHRARCGGPASPRASPPEELEAAAMTRGGMESAPAAKRAASGCHGAADSSSEDSEEEQADREDAAPAPNVTNAVTTAVTVGAAAAALAIAATGSTRSEASAGGASSAIAAACGPVLAFSGVSDKKVVGTSLCF